MGPNSTSQESTYSASNISDNVNTDTLKNLDSQAKLYTEQGKLNEAEPLRQRALAMREEMLGPEHLDTAESIHNLALLYLMQRKYYVGERLCRRALAIREKELGPNHPDTKACLDTLNQFITVQAQRVKKPWSLPSEFWPGLFLFVIAGFGLWVMFTSSVDVNATIFIKTVLGTILELVFGPHVGLLLETLVADSTTKRFQSSVTWVFTILRKPFLIGFYLISFIVLGVLFIGSRSIKAKSLITICFIALLTWIFYPSSVSHIPTSDPALSSIVSDLSSNISTLSSESLTLSTDVAFQTSAAPSLTTDSVPSLNLDSIAQTDSTLSTLSLNVSTKSTAAASSSFISDSTSPTFAPNAIPPAVASQKKSSWVSFLKYPMAVYFLTSFLTLLSEGQRATLYSLLSAVLIIITSLMEIIFMEKSMALLHYYYLNPRPIGLKLFIWGFFLAAFLWLGPAWFFTIAFFCNVVLEVLKLVTSGVPSNLIGEIFPIIINGLITWLILIPAL